MIKRERIIELINKYSRINELNFNPNKKKSVGEEVYYSIGVFDIEKSKIIIDYTCSPNYRCEPFLILRVIL